MQELQGNPYESDFYFCREIGSMGFPATIICTLRGRSQITLRSLGGWVVGKSVTKANYK